MKNIKLTKDQGILLFLFAITIIITLVPFFNVGFTTDDDFQYYITSLRGTDFWWQDAKCYANNAGRFYFLLVKPIYYIPYLVDNFYYTKIVQYVTLLVSYGLFAYFTYRIFKSKNLSLIVFLFLLSNTMLTSFEAYPTASYPFYFTFSLILCLTSMLLFFRYRDTGCYGYAIFGGVLYFVTLVFYETYIVFISFFCLYIFIRNVNKYGFKLVWKEKTLYKELLPYLSAIVLYVVLYFGWRAVVASNSVENFYEGSSFADSFSLSNYCNLLWKMTSFCFPFQSCMRLRGVLGYDTLMTDGVFKNLWFIMSNSDLILFVNAIFQSTLFILVVKNVDLKLFRKRKILLAMLIAVVIALLSHSILGIASKYNSGDWIASSNCYVSTFYSYFAIMLFMALVAILILKLVERTQIIKRILYVAMFVFVFLSSIVVGFANSRMSNSMAVICNYLKVMDYTMEQNVFDRIEENSIIYFDVDEYHITYLYRYIKFRQDRKFIWENSPDGLEEVFVEHPDAQLYYVRFEKTEEQSEVLFSVSKIRMQGLDKGNVDIGKFDAVSSDLFYYSPSKQFVLMYESRDFGTTLFDDRYVCISQKGLNVARIIRTGDGMFTGINMTGNFNPRKFCISNMSYDAEMEIDKSIETTTVGECAERIRSDEGRMEELVLKSDSTSLSLDDLILFEAESECYKEYIVSKYLKTINNTPYWRKDIEEKAAISGFPVEEMVYRDAVWMYENYDKRKIDEVNALLIKK